MQAKVIAMTKPVDNTLFSTPEEIITYCARVSNPSNQANYDTSEGLLRYLIKHKHWSPWEMVHVLVEIETTRDIARQILRHRSFSFQEFSQRYASIESLNLEPELRECRLQDEKNRQNSVVTENEVLAEGWKDAQEGVWDVAVETYKNALKQGIAKEQARALLPEGLTTSRLYMSGSLRSWLHYVELRSGNGTQLEHQLIAKDVGEQIAEHFPSTAGIINEYE